MANLHISPVLPTPADFVILFQAPFAAVDNLGICRVTTCKQSRECDAGTTHADCRTDQSQRLHAVGKQASLQTLHCCTSAQSTC